MSQEKINLNIFIHCASDYLTDNKSHGEGLICFSLLNGLALRGHKIYAFTPKASIDNKSENLLVYESTGPLMFDSLNSWKYSFEANRLFSKLSKEIKFDVVWRMNPVGYGCPILPETLGLPLVLGPLYYKWKNNAKIAKPRFIISLKRVLEPFAKIGWNKTIKNSKIIFCATQPHAKKISEKYNKKSSFELPLIVAQQEKAFNEDRFRKNEIIFLANLLENKRPIEFCKVIEEISKTNEQIRARIIGDGPERDKVEKYIQDNNLKENIEILGRIPNQEVLNYLKSSTFLINLSDGEPYGRNIAEAMSCGCIVVSHDSGGPSDFITNNLNGVLINSFNPFDFATEILEISSDPLKIKHLSENAYAKSREWSANNILSELEKNIIDSF